MRAKCFIFIALFALQLLTEWAWFPFWLNNVSCCESILCSSVKSYLAAVARIILSGDCCNVGDISISGDVAYDSDLLTLTCISTGGPATTVTWTRDSTTVTEGTVTVLDDPVTAQYTHTLIIYTGGEYTCNVSNNKPSSDSASINVTGIYTFNSSQLVHWFMHIP